MGWQDAGIECVSGKFGGGKSYWVTTQLRAHFLRGGFCAGNLALNWEAMKKHACDVHRVRLQDRQWIPLEDSQVPAFVDHIPQSRDPKFPVHVALDECGIFFNSDAWKTVDARIKTFLPQPRKAGIRLIVIIQEMPRLLKNIREQVAVLHRFRDLERMPWSDSKLELRLFGRTFALMPYFVHSVYDYKQLSGGGDVGKNDKPKKSEWIKKEAAVYGLYSSFHIHGGDLGMSEVEGRVRLERVPIWEPWVEKVGKPIWKKLTEL